MKSFLLITAVTLLFIFNSKPGTAQVLDPYEVPTDARSAALGEAFVSVAQGTAGMHYNIAGLAQTLGVGAQYDSRIFPESAPGAMLNYTSYSGLFGSQAFGTIGIYYSNHIYDNPTQPVYNENNVIIANNYNETSSLIQVGYANHLTPTMDAGVAVGYTHRDISGLVGSAAWLDFGIRYHESLFKTSTPDEFSFGLSVTHLGSTIEYNDAAGTTESLPRTLRAGFSWRIAQPETSWISNEFLSALLTGQYKNVLNQEYYGTAGYIGSVNSAAKGYWSLGFEAGAWDIFFFRYGLLYRPYNSVYSNANNGETTIGGGIKIPLHRLLGFSTPTYVTVDYSSGSLLAGGQETIISAGLHVDKDFIPTPPPSQEGQ